MKNTISKKVSVYAKQLSRMSPVDLIVYVLCDLFRNCHSNIHSTHIELLQNGVERNISSSKILKTYATCNNNKKIQKVPPAAKKQFIATDEETRLFQNNKRTVSPKIKMGSLEEGAPYKRNFGRLVSKHVPILSEMKTKGINVCEFSNLTADDIEPLAVALQGSKHLEYLKISDGKDFHSKNQIGTALQSCPQLRYLNLCDNNFDPKGSIALNSALGHYSNLEYLGLSGNNLGDEGLKQIVSGIPEKNNLRAIALSNNGITSSGVLEIANLILKCENLKMMWLDGNLIDDYGILELMTTLNQKSSL
ncbi:hypothetical protein HK096_011099, partial [Nowakowskiella sp. JEL0078]